jgi:Carboxypeptidase regulatory-like domain/TonB-dependent Receptor Plug Domain
MTLRLTAIIATSIVAGGAGPSSVGAQATVAGHVFDSTSRTMLTRAVVQLLRADNPAAPVAYSARTDSSGRFAIAGVSAGRYLAGFLHPLLDSLDVELPPRPIDVPAATSTVPVALAVPSAATIARAVCPANARSDSTGTIFGRLYDAETLRPLPAAAVTVRWTEITIGAGGARQQRPEVHAATDASGRFVFCNVPGDGVVGLLGARDADTTGTVELQLPGGGGARRDLFVGRVATTTRVDTVRFGDSTSTPIRRVLRRGTAQMSGTVRDSDGQPILGARLRVAESGVEAITDASGDFLLTNAPGGTQSVEVRAIGYFPESRTVDLVADRQASLHIRLATLRSVLDTVRVTASRVFTSDRNGFQQRRRSAPTGKFFDQDDVARLRPGSVVQLLNRVPGISITGDAFDSALLMRDMYTGGYCTPTVYIDGVPIRDLTVREVDSWVRPDEIAGMEIYSRAGSAPAEFTRLDGCGAVVVWTKRPTPRTKK